MASLIDSDYYQPEPEPRSSQEAKTTKFFLDLLLPHARAWMLKTVDLQNLLITRNIQKLTPGSGPEVPITTNILAWNDPYGNRSRPGFGPGFGPVVITTFY